MADIRKSVSSAFARTRDARIEYNIVEKGSASLLTGIYDQTDPATQGFYRKPEIAGDATKMAVIYGECMISPYTWDAGVNSSTNDPGSILKTYRFIAGDGVNSGVPVGPNGTPLENVYIKNPNQIPQPVVDSDGRPTLGNVILASALGSAIQSAPKIWDLIMGDAPASDKTKSVDPVTGKVIPSATEQAAALAAGKLALGQLTNVDESAKADNYILSYDATKGMWVAKSVNLALGNSGALAGSEVCGGSGGAGGNGGAGGRGGDGGTAGGTTPVTIEACYPSSSFVEYPCNTAPVVSKNGMVLLPTLANTANNEYTQSVNVLGTNGIDLHFHAGGNGREAVWNVAAGDTATCTDPANPTLCFVDPAKAIVEKPFTESLSVAYMDGSTFTIQICITANICGSEYLIYKTEFSESALSRTSYTFTAPRINWSATKLAPLLAKYPGQVFNNSNPNVKLYISRTDVCGSEYDLHFEGYKRIIGDSYYRPFMSPSTTAAGSTTVKAIPRLDKLDDGRFPEEAPQGGGMSAPSCPVETTLPGTVATPGEPGSPGTTGGAGTTGDCAAVDVAPEKAQPSIELASPCARQYGAQTTAPSYDAIQLPAAIIKTAIADQTVSVTWSIVVGRGTFSLAEAIPGSVGTNFGENSLTMTGNAPDVMTSSAEILIIPDDASAGEIHYTVVMTNEEGSRDGTACVLVPKQLTVVNNSPASAKICVDSSATGGSGKVFVAFNDGIGELTDGFVAFNATPELTAAAIASNINANVAFKNALDPSDSAWLPDFYAAASGLDITITAPSAGGSAFNGVTLTTSVTGGMVFGDCVGTFLGGVTKTVSDFLKNSVPQWDKVSDILVGIAGNVLGAVALNMIMNDAAQLQISIPTEEDVEVFFLYRGRVITVPAQYNAAGRSGHPTYESFNGVYKQEWTNNPGWCLYDFITNKKYGLGNDIVMTEAQSTALLKDIFVIAQHCDTVVGTKPLYSTNTVITEGTKFNILQQMASVFQGAAYFNRGGLRITIDRLDTNIKLLVNQANAGEFTKSLTSSSNFVNKVRLTYVEPSNFYSESIVIAEDSRAIESWGEKSADLIAFGCTDVDQALRYATWVLKSEIENSITVNYIAGLDHYNLVPGDIVEFYDSNERNVRRAGRVVSQVAAVVTLDAPIASQVGDYFSLTLADGTIHTTNIVAKSGSQITMGSVPGVPAASNAIFIAASAAQGRRLYKVIKTDETSNSKFAITLQRYVIDKY